MDELQQLQARIATLEAENEALKKMTSDITTKQHDLEMSYAQLKINAENIIIKAVNVAYEIKMQITEMLESLKGQSYEQGVKIITDFVRDHKHFLGASIAESRKTAEAFADDIINKYYKK